MASSLILAEFFTRDHRVRGQVHTGTKRLTDVLNDELHSSIEAVEVQVARISHPAEVVFTYPSAVLLKDGIVFAIVPGERSNGAEGRIFKYIEKRPYDVFLTIPPFEISGLLHLRGTGDLRTLLTREMGRFIPMTQASAVYTPRSEVRFSGEVAIVHKNLIEVIGSLEAK